MRPECPECGKINPEDATACVVCGASFKSAKQVGPAETSARVQPDTEDLLRELEGEYGGEQATPAAAQERELGENGRVAHGRWSVSDRCYVWSAVAGLLGGPVMVYVYAVHLSTFLSGKVPVAAFPFVGLTVGAAVGALVGAAVEWRRHRIAGMIWGAVVAAPNALLSGFVALFMFEP